MSAMKEKVEILSASDLKPIFNELDAMKTMVSELSENCQPIFHGKRYLTDHAISRRLNICKRTLATYRANGLLGYYNLPGKMEHCQTSVDEFLRFSRKCVIDDT